MNAPTASPSSIHGETPPHPRVIEARSIYARALAVTGDLVRGIAMLEAALADSRALLGPKNLHAGMLVQNLVGYRLDLGELELADANAAEALTILAEYFAPDSMNYAMLVHTRATTHLALRHTAAALDQATRATEAFDRLLGVGHEVTIRRPHDDRARADARRPARCGGARDRRGRAAHRGAGADERTVGARGAGARHACPPAGTTLRRRCSICSRSPIRAEPPPKWQRERMRAWAQIGLRAARAGRAGAGDRVARNGR